MNIIPVKLEELEKPIILELGFAGENMCTGFSFACDSVFSEYPDAIPSMAVTPPKGSKYPVVVTRDGNNVLWNITDSDTAYMGSGEVQLIFTQNNVVKRSYTCRTRILKSILAEGTPPDPVQSWIDSANEMLAEIPETIDAAIDTAIAAAKASGEFKGDPGFSPVVTTAPITGGNSVTITDEQGEHSFNVLNGANGVSPDLSVTPFTGGHRITIVDASGTNTFDVTNGVDATPDLITVDYANLTFPVAKGATCYHNGQMFEAKVAIQTAEEWDSTKWDPITVEEQIGSVLTAIGEMPDLHESTASDVDLDISDENGNVILRLKNGHVHTKNFDSSKTPFIEGSDAEGVDLDISDQNGNVIVRLKDGHIKTKYFDSSQAVVVDNLNPLSVINDGISMLSGFDTVGCIGDSLASGECVYDGGAIDKYDISWGQIMARMNGNTAFNFSIGGLTTRTWLSRYTGNNPTDDAFQENPCQAYIIALGQNDSYSGDSRFVQLGTVEDIGTETDSFYGNMSRIIAKIKALQARAKIFIMTDPYEVNETGGYNDAVRYIAAHTTNCYLIDLYTYALNIDPHDRNNSALWRGGHLTTTGYFLSAKIINTYIDWIMKNNLAEFKYIQFIGTEYNY